MRVNPVTVKPDTTVKEAAELMLKKKIGNCIVVDEKPIGIITESDILKKVVAKDIKASEVNVEKIMKTPLIIIDPYINLEEAMKTMSRCDIRRLPIVENGQLIGIITVKDIIRLSPMLLEITREWGKIDSGDKIRLQKQTYSGKCEDCGTLSTNLKVVDGRLICDDCVDALNYD